MKYLFDNCISHRLVNMLAALDVSAVSLRSVLPQDVGDVELFAYLNGSDSVFVSCDLSQRTRPLEARALKESGVTALYLGPFWGKMQFWQQAVWLVTRWETIDKAASSAVKGSFAEIKRNGKALYFTL